MTVDSASLGLGIDAGAASATVDLEKDRQDGASGCGRLLNGANGVEMVDEDVEGVDLVIEGGSLGDFPRGDRNCIGDVGESPSGEGTGLGKGGDRDASEGVRSLDPRRLHALVGFNVGPETNAEPPRLLRHPLCVGLETIEIDQRTWCREIVEVHVRRVSERGNVQTFNVQTFERFVHENPTR